MVARPHAPLEIHQTGEPLCSSVSSALALSFGNTHAAVATLGRREETLGDGGAAVRRRQQWIRAELHARTTGQ